MNIILFGGAGSLGRAFVARLHKDHELTIWDSSEWATAELKGLYPDCKFVLDDYSNWRYERDPADVIVILSAFKHVNLGEENPYAFIENNVVKLKRVLDEASMGGADALFISSDKAVEPSNTYGYTKALGEDLVEFYGGSVARLGNILSSSGSVIPLWEDAIAHEEPLKLTDVNMTRFVIEDYDAALRIWDAFVNGERLIIPPCTEVNLMDLASRVLAKHGYETPQEYQPGIELIGRRPGEKLSEKLRWPHENA